MQVRLNGREIATEAAVTIGRDPACDLECTDPRTSRRHAVLEPVGEGWEVEDRSSNGTFLNGRRIARLPVTGPITLHLGHPVEGDVLELLPVRVVAGTFIETAPPPTPPPTPQYRPSSINHLVHDLDAVRPCSGAGVDENPGPTREWRS